MNVLLLFFVWCLVFIICWPIALIALLAAPLVWLLALPFRLAGVCVHALFAFVRAVLFLPARVLGYRPA